MRARLRRFGFSGSGVPVLFAGMSVVNVSNLAFNLAMTRLLGVAGYGALGSLLGLSTIVTIAASGMQAAVTQSVAAGARSATAPRIWVGRPLRRGVMAGTATMLAVAVATPGIRSFLHIGPILPVIWLAAYLVPVVASLVPQGVLLGQLRFREVALANVAAAVVRLGAGIALAEAGFGLSGAVFASTLSGTLLLGLLVWPLRHDMRRHSQMRQLDLHPGTTILSVVAIFGYSIFLGVDSVLARHFLSPVESGYYVAGLTAGRIALFLPGAVAIAAFPYFASANQDAPDTARRHLRNALLAVGAIGAIAAAVMIAVPGLVVTTMFGTPYRPAAGVVGILALTSATVGLVNILTYFYLSRRSRGALGVWLGIAAAAAGIALFHPDPSVIATVMLTVSATMAVALVLPTLKLPALVSGATGGRRVPPP